MNKKIIAIALTFSLPLTVSAFSGDKCDSDGHRANRIEHLTKSLGLDDEQKTKMEAIFKEQGDKFKTIHEETQARMKQVLTKEQMAKMDEMKKQRQEKWQKKCEALKDKETPKQTK